MMVQKRIRDMEPGDCFYSANYGLPMIVIGRITTLLHRHFRGLKVVAASSRFGTESGWEFKPHPLYYTEEEKDEYRTLVPRKEKKGGR